MAFPYVGQGAYVDLGYGYDTSRQSARVAIADVFRGRLDRRPSPWFFTPRALSDVFGNQLAPGYAVYDTWSFHYENNGVNEDDESMACESIKAPMVLDDDEGTNG